MTFFSGRSSLGQVPSAVRRRIVPSVRPARAACSGSFASAFTSASPRLTFETGVRGHRPSGRPPSRFRAVADEESTIRGRSFRAPLDTIRARTARPRFGNQPKGGAPSAPWRGQPPHGDRDWASTNRPPPTTARDSNIVRRAGPDHPCVPRAAPAESYTTPIPTHLPQGAGHSLEIDAMGDVKAARNADFGRCGMTTCRTIAPEAVVAAGW